MAWAIVNQAQTEEDRRWGAEYWHKTYGFSTFDLTRFTEEDKATTTLPANGAWVELPTIHAFGDTGDAYDACQCDAKIGTGDTLVIEEESVVGLAYAWPIAVTVCMGKFHQLKPGHEIMDTIDGITEAQVRQAVKEATTRGLTIAPEFERFKA